MSADSSGVPRSTNARQAVDSELERWRRIFAGEEYYYGDEPGPVARRAVRYHRAFVREGGTALDAGCGEGQDLAFLVERGYRATGIEFTPEGARKARLFLERHGLEATVLHEDLRGMASDEVRISNEATRHSALDTRTSYDLVLAVNAVQFLGPDAPACLDALMERVAPGGVMGLSLFAREPGEPALAGTVYFFTFEEVMERFRGWQRLEAARLWQWNPAADTPQAFVTMIARKLPPARQPLMNLK